VTSERNRLRIAAALAQTQLSIGINPPDPEGWMGRHYQTATRIAPHRWLSEHGVGVWLVYLPFTNDPISPANERDWKTALTEAHAELGLSGVQVPDMAHAYLEAR
jgi:hypothetical protein